MIRIDRHELGPRVYVLGRRIHECGVGAGLLAVLAAGGATDRVELTRPIDAATGFAAYLLVKDWRDLFPSRRNKARWSLLLHRVPRD